MWLAYRITFLTLEFLTILTDVCERTDAKMKRSQFEICDKNHHKYFIKYMKNNSLWCVSILDQYFHNAKFSSPFLENSSTCSPMNSMISLPDPRTLLIGLIVTGDMEPRDTVKIRNQISRLSYHNSSHLKWHCFSLLSTVNLLSND